MQDRIITEELVEAYSKALQEYSKSTRERYYRDAVSFFLYTRGSEVDQEVCQQYEEMLKSKYSLGSINLILNGLNTFFGFAGWNELRFRLPKYRSRKGLCREQLTFGEYKRLLAEASRLGDQRLFLLMQVLCTLRLKVSEHTLITREALDQGYFILRRKGSIRGLFIPHDLKTMLMEYCERERISSGPVFRTANGGIYHRSNIHKDMKQLCQGAQVKADKVTPQQLLNLAVSEPVVQFVPEDKNVV